MYTETTIEWWKLRIYHEVSEFLNNPSSGSQTRLINALQSYEAFYQQNKPTRPTSIDDYERLISA